MANSNKNLDKREAVMVISILLLNFDILLFDLKSYNSITFINLSKSSIILAYIIEWKGWLCILVSQKNAYQAQVPATPLRNKGCVMPAEALMPTMLVQEHKDKTITHTVHEILTWFDQPCLRPRMRENNSTIQ